MNALPFDIAKLLPKEFVKFGSLKIPKFGSLTPSEQVAMNAIDDDLILTLFKVEVCKVLIASRCEGVAEDLDLAHVPLHLIDELYEFAKGEVNRWKVADQGEAEGEKKQDLIEPSLISDLNTPA